MAGDSGRCLRSEGRPCDASSFESGQVDLLAPTPDATHTLDHDDQSDFFSHPANGKSREQAKEEEEKPWTHVRWVLIDSFSKPIEIARLSRRGARIFPPAGRRVFILSLRSPLRGVRLMCLVSR